MRLSPERLFIRKGIIDGVGRVVRAMYEQESSDPLPESGRSAAEVRAARGLPASANRG
jgi:hypothetical protein